MQFNTSEVGFRDTIEAALETFSSNVAESVIVLECT